MEQFVLNLISNFGLLGMFLGMILEAVIIVIPSELILATGGILASRKVFSFFSAFLVGLIGSVFCAIILYAMGKYGGRPFIKKYGKYFFMKEKDLSYTEDWFNKYGIYACFIGRNFPIVRTFISIPCGIYNLSFTKFFIYTTLGSIPWTFVFVYVGYQLGNNWILLSNYTEKLKIPIIILIIVLIIRSIYNKKKK